MVLALALPVAAALVPSPSPFVPEVALGYAIAPLAPIDGATAITFGPDGNLYATTLLGEVQQVTLTWTPAGPVATGISTVASGFSQPLGVVFGPDDAMYVTDSVPESDSGRIDGQVTRIDAFGSTVVVAGLPNGRHNTNNMKFGPDGRLYIANGNSNDNGIDGGELDVRPYSGAILSVDAAQVTDSPAVLHWRDADGAHIAADAIAAHPINADFASKVHVLAHGFRNVYDVAFDADGVAWTAMNGADTPDAQDAVFRIAPGTDYGYPYCFNQGTPGGRDVTVVANPTFPGHDCSGVPSAFALIGWHTCATGTDAPPSGSAFAGGVYVGECFALQPDRVVQRSLDDPANAGHNVAHKVVRVDEAGVHDFATGFGAVLDVQFGPDGAMYIADVGMIYRVVALPVPHSTQAAPTGVATTIVAAPGAWVTQFATPVAAASPGGTLAFANLDIMRHDVVARDDARPDGSAPWCDLYPSGACPLFWSTKIGQGATTPVLGLDALEAGRTYAYYCTIHPGMSGTLLAAPDLG